MKQKNQQKEGQGKKSRICQALPAQRLFLHPLQTFGDYNFTITYTISTSGTTKAANYAPFDH
jgi:hypothetical protein